MFSAVGNGKSRELSADEVARGVIVAREQFGKQLARYAFLLNPYSDLRLSKCPTCNKLTHSRKFPLIVHADGWGPLALGKTCRYCSRCELIIAHKDELDAELAHALFKLAPQAAGEDYFVLGTLDRKVWKCGLRGEAQSLAEVMEHVAGFEKILQLEVDPGGYRPAEK